MSFRFYRGLAAGVVDTGTFSRSASRASSDENRTKPQQVAEAERLPPKRDLPRKALPRPIGWEYVEPERAASLLIH